MLPHFCFWSFRFGSKNEISGKNFSTKMISTFLVSVNMCVKLILKKGKHILKPAVGYIAKEKFCSFKAL